MPKEKKKYWKYAVDFESEAVIYITDEAITELHRTNLMIIYSIPED